MRLAGIDAAARAQRDWSKSRLLTDRFQSHGARDRDSGVAEGGGGEHVGQGIPKLPVVGQRIDADAVVPGAGLVAGPDRQDHSDRSVELHQRDADAVAPGGRVEQRLHQVRVLDERANGVGDVFGDELGGGE